MIDSYLCNILPFVGGFFFCSTFFCIGYVIAESREMYLDMVEGTNHYE